MKALKRYQLELSPGTEIERLTVMMMGKGLYPFATGEKLMYREPYQGESLGRGYVDSLPPELRPVVGWHLQMDQGV